MTATSDLIQPYQKEPLIDPHQEQVENKTRKRIKKQHNNLQIHLKKPIENKKMKQFFYLKQSIRGQYKNQFYP
jgi:hypothetical protein